jgi:hypothetical protein
MANRSKANSAAKGRSSKKKSSKRQNVIKSRPPEKQKVPIKGDNVMPEIFDSSKANAMDEMKESATMQQRDLTKTLSHMQKQEPVQPESVVTRPTPEEATNIDLPAINPTIEERASVVKESEQAAHGRMDDDEMFA